MASNKTGHDAVYQPLSLEIEDQPVKKSKHNIILYLSAVGACFMTFRIGTHIVWTSPIIWKLRSNDTEINPFGEPLKTYQIAILTGLFPLGAAIGPLFLTKICDVIGRKNSLMLLSAIDGLSSIVVALSTHIYIYYLSRFLYGICSGVGVAVVSIFLSEISENHNRGLIGCFMGVSFPVGNLYVYMIGPLFSIKIFTLLCTLPSFANILCFLMFIPESPHYLASKGLKEKSINALERLRNQNASAVEKEYEMIVQTLKTTSTEDEVTWKTMFTTRSLRRGFIIAVALNSMPHLTGIGAILAYAGPLFDASGSSLKGDTVAILIGLVCTAASILTTVLIDRVGRRPLLIASSFGSSIPHLLLGAFFYLKQTHPSLINGILLLPVLSVLIYITFFSVGLGVIPIAIMSELLPSNAKAKCSSICCFTNFFLFFLVSIIFPIMNDLMGPSWCLWMFGLLAAAFSVFVYFLVPEIKGKSLLEVQELLSK